MAIGVNVQYNGGFLPPGISYSLPCAINTNIGDVELF